MPRVVWRDQATDDLENIISYISDFDPAAGMRVGGRLRTLAESLIRSPERGQPMGRYRELVSERPFIIRYSVQDEVVLIHSIRHSRRLSLA